MPLPPVLPDLARPLDPALPGIAAAMSAQPPGTSPDDDCRVRSVEWIPRRRCRVVQEVRSAAPAPALVAYEVTPSGTIVRDLSKDPRLPGLRVALDPVRIRHRLEQLCWAPVRDCLVTPVSYRVDTRAVLAYDVRTEGGRSRFYAKLLAEGSHRYAAAAAAIASSARRRAAPVPVPGVVALWPDLGAVVQREAPGRSLSGVLADASLPERERIDHAELLGRLLADVHATPLGARPLRTAEEELAELESLLPPVCHGNPAVGRSLAALVDRLADLVPPGDGLVLSHGAFRTGQVVTDGRALSLLDLDTVCTADAARDVGNALAYLSWADVRGALPGDLVPRLHDAFLAGYGGRRQERLGGLAWWTAAAMAKIAGRRFRGLATTEWPDVPELLTRAGALLESTEGGRRQPRPESDATRFDPTDPVSMTGILRGQPSLRTAPHLRVSEARTLDVATGRRCVVRYEIDGIDAGASVAVIGKVYTDRHRSSIAYENLRLFRDEVFPATPWPAVPSPLCHIPALRTVLYREVAGPTLDRLSDGRAEAVACLAAGWLSALHRSGMVLARRLDLDHEVADAGRWAAVVGESAPDARRAAYALADRLAATAAALPSGPEVPVHRDFHAGHVIAVGDGVAVIDLDEARMGDPSLDVSSFVTYLEVAAHPGAGRIRDAFLTAYGPVPGPAPEVRSAFFAAFACLKIAKQLVTGRGPVRPATGEARTAALIGVLSRGSACLDG